MFVTLLASGALSCEKFHMKFCPNFISEASDLYKTILVTVLGCLQEQHGTLLRCCFGHYTQPEPPSCQKEKVEEHNDGENCQLLGAQVNILGVGKMYIISIYIYITIYIYIYI